MASPRCPKNAHDMLIFLDKTNRQGMGRMCALSVGSLPVRDGICVYPPLCRGTSQGKIVSSTKDLVCVGEDVGKMGE